jgi:hypothetical protein
MQATITYLLTEQAQRAQMAATGQPVASKQTVVEEVPNDLVLSPLATIGEEGRVSFDLTKSSGLNEDGRYVGKEWGYVVIRAGEDAVPDSGLAALQKRIAAIAAESDKLAASYASNQVIRRQREQEESARRQKADAEYAARKKAEEAEREVSERAKSAYIAEWVANHGDPDLSAQLADGLACRKTLILMIADEAFAAAGVPEKIDVPDTCSSSDCPCCDTSVDCLPRRIYAVWRKLKATLPQGSTATFAKVRECLAEEIDRYGIDAYSDEVQETAGPLYYTATISMPHGPFKFERRVKLEVA